MSVAEKESIEVIAQSIGVTNYPPISCLLSPPISNTEFARSCRFYLFLNYSLIDNQCVLVSIVYKDILSWHVRFFIRTTI
ncbi:hypothetical protein HanHA89_Chr05g0204001 [Helianthus annuus]|nr:hypothetical protein HanHA89_Chr05g0204001 [Helianthus annuus]